MTLTELRYIVAVAKERHFGHAAESCFVSQPTLSVAVRKLEDELGVTLFERAKGQVRVTPVGEQVVAQARKVLSEVSVITELAREGSDPLTTPLRLGAIYTVGPYLLPHLVPMLKEQAPRMPLLFEENYTAVLAERLQQGELDVIVISLPFDEPGIETVPLYDEPFVVLLPAAHPWNQEERIDPLRLAQENVLMLGAGHCFRDQILTLCPSCARGTLAAGVQETVEGSSLETIRHMVASGLGITVLPCTSAGAGRYSERLVTIRRFTAPAPRRRIALAFRTSFPRQQAVQAVRNAVLSSGLTCVETLGE
ncbi:MAG: LysR substrate-binding domain-containing protein [Gammaproteobacteria bacterium]|nr:LysR substrate-binding domain-containing protein [Gammaproteobacteria bacterium]